MPVGSAIAAVYDNNAMRYLGLSQPVSVVAGKVSVVDPVPPKVGSDVLAIIDRPHLVSRVADDDIELFLAPDGKEQASPDVFISSAGRVIGVWYGIEGKYATLEAVSKSVFLEPQEIGLALGGVTSFRGDFRDRPDLEVQIELPDQLKRADIQLEVFRKSDRSLIRELRLDGGTTLATIPDLPPESLTVALGAVPWRFKNTVDLSDGFDATLVVAPTPIRVTGRVFLGDDGHPAELSFSQGRGPTLVSTVSDDDGTYEAEFFSTGMYIVRTVLIGASSEPMVEMALILSDKELDSHVPDNRFFVRVTDAETNEGVALASVMVDNKWGDSTVSNTYTTNEEGMAELPPVRPGSLLLSATAEDYLSSKVTEHSIDEKDQGRTIEIPLDPKKQGDDLILQLLDGRPARGAEAQIVRYYGEWPPFWQGIADENGKLSIPANDGLTFLLVRHQTAGFMAMELPSAINLSGGAPVTLPKSGPPITIQAIRSNGDTVAGASVFLWVDSLGAWASNRLLLWLTWSDRTTTASDGLWVCRGVPEGPIRVATVKHGGGQPLDLNTVDALATGFAFPWPNPTVVQIIE